MDPHKPTNPKDDHYQLPKRTWAPVEPLSPQSEKLLGDYYDRELETMYRRPRDSDDDSDEDPWLHPPLPIVPPVQRPAKSYPQEPPDWATYEWPPQGASSSQKRAMVEAEKNTMPGEKPCWATYEWPLQGASSSQKRATVEAEKNTLPVEQEITYFNMLTELTKINTTTMSEMQLRAHEGQIAFLCNKLGIDKP